MSDHLKLLDGTVEEITKAIAALSATDRAALLAAEQDGKKRKGVIAVLQPDVSPDGAVDVGGDEAGIVDQGEPLADIAPATEFAPSGAPVQIAPDLDLSHPALDTDPRAGTTELQNRIDFNDPRKSGQEVVEEALGRHT